MQIATLSVSVLQCWVEQSSVLLAQCWRRIEIRLATRASLGAATKHTLCSAGHPPATDIAGYDPNWQLTAFSHRLAWFCVVLSGIWWCNSGADFDPARASRFLPAITSPPPSRFAEQAQSLTRSPILVNRAGGGSEAGLALTMCSPAKAPSLFIKPAVMNRINNACCNAAFTCCCVDRY